jgi:hypothetical protein
MHFAKFTVSILALTLVGCATHTVQKPPAAAQQKRASKSSDDGERKKPLVAPPPAYGNLVVSTEVGSPPAG